MQSGACFSQFSLFPLIHMLVKYGPYVSIFTVAWVSQLTSCLCLDYLYFRDLRLTGNSAVSLSLPHLSRRSFLDFCRMSSRMTKAGRSKSIFPPCVFQFHSVAHQCCLTKHTWCDSENYHWLIVCMWHAWDASGLLVRGRLFLSAF